MVIRYMIQSTLYSNIQPHGIEVTNLYKYKGLTISLLRQNGKFIDEEFAHYACEHNMKWADSNLFVDSSVNSLSNCCRLKSNIKDLG